MADIDSSFTGFPIATRKTTDITAKQAMVAIKGVANTGLDETEIAAAFSNIDTNTSDIATNTADIASNTADIASNTADIATNTSDIATNTADIATLDAEVGEWDFIYYLNSFYQGVLTDGEMLYIEKLSNAVTFPAGFVGSSVYADVASTIAVSIDVQKNGVSVGTIDFAIGANDATFTLAADVTFAIGDIIKLVAPATADITLADIGISLKGSVQ